MNSFAAKLALLSGATLVALIGAEIVVRAVQSISPNRPVDYLTEYDATLGWSKARNATAKVDKAEFQVTERTNSQGLRGPDVEFAKPEGTLRVLLLGDSFLEGYTVNEADLVSEVVRSELESRLGTQVDVINAGTVGYSTDQELLFYESEGRKYSPDLTIVMFYVNDVWFNHQSSYWRGRKPYFELNGGALELKNNPVPAPDPESFAYAVQAGQGFTGMIRGMDATLGRHSTLYQTARDVVRETPMIRGLLTETGLVPVPGEWTPWRKRMTPELSSAWAVTEALLARLRDGAESDGSAFAAFYVPSRPAVYPSDWEQTKTTYAMDDSGWDPANDAVELRNICERQRFDCLIPIDEFRAEARRLEPSGESLYFWEDAHWSPHGHRLAGELIGELAAQCLSPDPR